MISVDESKPGLTHARERGMKSAKYDVYLFCDDDNWLECNYVQLAFDTFKEGNNIGAVGGWCEAVFQDYKPEWFDRFARNFAVGRPANETGILSKPSSFLFGAGLAIRKEAMIDLMNRGFRQILSDRKGNKLSSGGDVELCFGLKLAGYSLFFNEEMYFKHYMPKNRMTYEYLKKLRKAMSYADYVLGIYVKCLKGKKEPIKGIYRKYRNQLRQLKDLNAKLQHADRFEALDLQTQIDVRRFFLKNPLAYYRMSKKICRYA